MTIRRRLALLALLAAGGIAGVTALFTASLGSLEGIARDQEALVVVADAVRDLSIAVNGLESNQYRNQAKRLEVARARTEEAFAAVSGLTVLPRIGPEMAQALEVIGNMHQLVTDDLASLAAVYGPLKDDLERYLLESNSTAPRQLLTDPRLRNDPRLAPVFQRLDDLQTGILGATETLAGVSDTIASQGEVIRTEADRIRSLTWGLSVAASAVILGLVAALVWFMGASLARRVNRLREGLARVGSGDFTHDLGLGGQDEISRIAASANGLQADLSRFVAAVQTDLDQLGSQSDGFADRAGEAAGAARAIQDGVNRIAGTLEQETAAIGQLDHLARQLGEAVRTWGQSFERQRATNEESLAAVESMIGGLQETAQAAAEGEGAADRLAAAAREGQTGADQVRDAVSRIGRSSENLVRVAEVLRDIADRTNLLAMNASIEAAHAGASGRGFAVVAQEIRTLALEASRQSGEIGRDLAEVQTNLGGVEGATALALAAFARVLGEADPLGNLVHRTGAQAGALAGRGQEVRSQLEEARRTNDELHRAVDLLRRVGEGVQGAIGRLTDQHGELTTANREVLDQASGIAQAVARTGAEAAATKDRVAGLRDRASGYRTREQAAG